MAAAGSGGADLDASRDPRKELGFRSGPAQVHHAEDREEQHEGRADKGGISGDKGDLARLPETVRSAACSAESHRGIRSAPGRPAAQPGDLLVLGYKRAVTAQGLVHDSVTRYCLLHARCPVLVVPAGFGRGAMVPGARGGPVPGRPQWLIASRPSRTGIE